MGSEDTACPYVGEPSNEHRAVCVYAPTPAGPKCDQPATVHVMVDSDRWGRVALSSCDDHRGVALASGTAIDEHPHQLLCGLPGTLWMFPPVSACLLDDSGVEQTATALAEASA
jgi:hypothetical protein